MAWQRLLCVGFYAVALSSAAYGAPAAETSQSGMDAKPVLAKKHVVTSKAIKAHHPVKSKTATAKGGSRPVHQRERKVGQVGYASWYGSELNGMSMAGGGRFNQNELTAAHPTLPLYSRARVTNMTNGRSVTVRITDRGPSHEGRIIDLSQSAAEEIGMRNSGVARVHVEPFVGTNLP
jgi:rare lipoprotein A